MDVFTAQIEIIGVNPYVHVPVKILQHIYTQAGRDRGSIPICGTVNGKKYKQTLVKYRGEWRLYINTSMLADSPRRIGHTIRVSVEYDPKPRNIPVHPKLTKALNANPVAKKVFDGLSPSGQKEIVRYIARLKSDIHVEKNIERAIGFLLGKNRFVGRDRPR